MDTWDTQILNVKLDLEYVGILAGDVTWITFFQFGILWVSFMTSESKFPSPQKRSKGSRQGFLEEPSKWKL